MSVKLKSSAGTRLVPTIADLQPQALENVSLNTVLTPGTYYFGTTSGVTDCEVSTAGAVFVVRTGMGTYSQILFTGTTFYLRTNSGGAWGAWRKVTSELY